ncbi:uncharacterized protein An11g00540 [Aspergillus niger]|uniref:Contig An11c0010, genomic contig n=2 Tax=Aspergillus niger TaxID=5061 RepID=A5ABI9_ASPNC|nr:uncharacterized protein An11g00540 [Aspergillus niger]CAK48287.1 unnamed protein product [Aspergillus niger]
MNRRTYYLNGLSHNQDSMRIVDNLLSLSNQSNLQVTVSASLSTRRLFCMECSDLADKVCLILRHLHTHAPALIAILLVCCVFDAECYDYKIGGQVERLPSNWANTGRSMVLGTLSVIGLGQNGTVQMNLLQPLIVE